MKNMPKHIFDYNNFEYIFYLREPYMSGDTPQKM